MTKPGFLHRWIAKNHQAVWPNLNRRPRLLGARAARALQMQDFVAFGKYLSHRFARGAANSTEVSVEFEILRIDSPGAWAIWPTNYYGVLMTTGLVRKVQRIGGIAEDALSSGLDAEVKNNFFRVLWGDLPRDQEHLGEFGALVAHIAFAFLVHHELAHIALGHDSLAHVRRNAQSIAAGVPAADQLLDYLDEFAGVLGRQSTIDQIRFSQALETDADVHAMLYTRRLINEEADAIRRRTTEVKHVKESSLLVWGELLRDTRSKQLMLLVGISVGLLALQKDLEGQAINKSFELTHPPLASRVLLAFHVAGSLTKFDDGYWEARSAAITTAIMLFGAYQKEESVGSEIIKPDTPHDPTLPDTKWQTMKHLPIVEAMLRFREFGAYWEELAAHVRKYSPALFKYSKFPGEMHIAWYTAGNAQGPYSEA